MMVGDDYTARVARGAELLDSVRPGWDEQLSLDTLAMEKCDRCVLGQVYGDYRSGFWVLTRPLSDRRLFCAGDYGFTLFEHEQGWFTDEEEEAVLGRFCALANAWRALVRERRSSARKEV